MIWNNIYPAEAHKFEQFRNVTLKSEEVALPYFRKTSQHFGGTCKPATVSKGYRSTKSLGNPVLVTFKKYFLVRTILCSASNKKGNIYTYFNNEFIALAIYIFIQQFYVILPQCLHYVNLEHYAKCF